MSPANLVLVLLFLVTVVLIVIGLVRKAMPLRTLGVLYLLVGLFKLLAVALGYLEVRAEIGRGGVPDPDLLMTGILWSLLDIAVGLGLMIVGLVLLIVGLRRRQRRPNR